MKWPVVPVLVALGIARGAAAQTSAVELSLGDAVARGLAASHRVAEAGARQEAAAAAIAQREAVSKPSVALLGGYTRTNNIEEFGVPTPTGQIRVIYPNVPDNYRARLDVAWPIYTAGRLTAIADAARLEASAADKDSAMVRTDLRFEITRAFWALVVADESRRVVGEALARTTAHVANVRNALEAGLVPPNDLLTAQAQESRQRMVSIQAQSARDVAELELARLVGLPPGTSIQPREPLDAPAVDAAPEALVLRALEQRADRQGIHDRITAVSARERAAAAGRKPTVSIGGGVDYARPNPRIFPRVAAWNESWDASINVSWPLFDGGRSRGEVAEAVAQKRVLEERLAELDSLVALDIRQRLADLRSSAAAIAAADDAVRAATEALRVVNDRYAAGVAISTDVLDAQVVLLQATLDRTQAIVNARVTAARLDRAIGR